MRYLTKTLDFDSRGDSVVTLGKFDGLHRGHMLLIRRVLAIGRTEGLETVVFTFDVPPQSKVQHVKPHQLLTKRFWWISCTRKKLLWERISVLATREAAQPKC